MLALAPHFGSHCHLLHCCVFSVLLREFHTDDCGAAELKKMKVEEGVGKLKIADAAKVVAAKWRLMTDEEKQKWKREKPAVVAEEGDGLSGVIMGVTGGMGTGGMNMGSIGGMGSMGGMSSLSSMGPIHQVYPPSMGQGFPLGTVHGFASSGIHSQVQIYPPSNSSLTQGVAPPPPVPDSGVPAMSSTPYYPTAWSATNASTVPPMPPAQLDSSAPQMSPALPDSSAPSMPPGLLAYPSAPPMPPAHMADTSSPPLPPPPGQPAQSK